MYEWWRTAFPKDLVGIGEREKVDKDDRSMALYKESLNRLELFCLRKRWFKRFIDIEWNKEAKQKIIILSFYTQAGRKQTEGQGISSK